MHAYISANVAKVVQPEEILRAEWVARVSALDLYVHEFVAQRMLAIFDGSRPKTPGFQTFKLPTETVDRIRTAATPADANAAFDLEVRRQLGFSTFQDPEKIADGIRLCSAVELWNSIAMHQGATEATKSDRAKRLKRTLSAIVERRNKIAHGRTLADQPGRSGDREYVHRENRPLDRCRRVTGMRSPGPNPTRLVGGAGTSFDTRIDTRFSPGWSGPP
jgi:hypothetical protein